MFPMCSHARVSSFHPESILDYASAKLDLALTCLRCGREAVYDPAAMHAFYTSKGWDTRTPPMVRMFRCRCGSREHSLKPIPSFHRPDPLPKPNPMLEPLYVRLGNGWRSADPDGRPEPAIIRILRDLCAEDKDMRFAWRVRQRGERWHAEVQCACPWAGANPAFTGKGATEIQALAHAVAEAVSYWRGPTHTRHAPLSADGAATLRALIEGEPA